MELASVSSIGGGAVAFFQSPVPFAYTPRQYRSTDIYLAGNVLDRCERSARRIQEKAKDIYGAIDEPGVLFSGQSRRGALFCRSGTWLEIHNERSSNGGDPVRGSPIANTKHGVLDFISVAIGLISIRGVESSRYLCMNATGSLYSAPFANFSSECVFLEEMMENYYNIYSSCRFGSPRRPWYVALSRRGKQLNSTSTRKRRKATHFLVVHYDEPSTRKNQVMLDDFLPVLERKAQRFGGVASYTVEWSSHSITPKPTLSPEEKRKRRRKKKRRRQERLQREEEERKKRREELARLRDIEQRQRIERQKQQSKQTNRPATIRARRPPSI